MLTAHFETLYMAAVAESDVGPPIEPRLDETVKTFFSRPALRSGSRPCVAEMTPKRFAWRFSRSSAIVLFSAQVEG